MKTNKKKITLKEINKEISTVRQGLKDAKENKVYGPYTSVKELIKSLDSKRDYNILDWIEIYWYRYFWNYVSSIPLRVKSFFQRGYRGWAHSDTWDFDYYLSKVIAEGVQNLININSTDDSKRIKDFKEIVKTMKLAIKVNEKNIYYSKEKYDEMKKEFDRGMKILAKRWFEMWD